ncbi:MAG: hypothetical protein QXO01_00570 [Nitrososphaerota archaeon]
MRRVRELESLGIDSLMVTEGGLLLARKGFRSVVLVGTSGGRLVAIKVLRSDSPVKSMEHEARMLGIANNVNVGPRILSYTNEAIIMEYIQGPEISSWISSLSLEYSKDLRKVLRMCFEECFKLDSIGLDHGELSDASKHVIVEKGLRPVVIDFSNANTTRKVSNVTSFLSYITYGRVAKIIRQILGMKEQDIDVVRAYKQRISEENFIRLMINLGL